MSSFLSQHSGSTIFSVALHAAIAAALTIGLDFRREPPPAQHLIIEAVIVDQASIDREQQRREEIEQAEAQRRLDEERRAREAEQAAQREREQREAEQRAEEQRVAAEAERVREQQEAEAREAERQRQLEAQRESAERERAAEEARVRAQQEAEQRQREEQERLAAQREEEEERQRVAAEERRRQEEEEQRRLQAEADARQQAELEAELQRAAALEAERLNAVRSGQLDQYIRLIQNRIEQNWSRPASARPGLSCTVNVTQIPSGEVINVRVGACNGDEAVVRSIEAAVLRSSPLPLPPSPSLFERNLNLTFIPD